MSPTSILRRLPLAAALCALCGVAPLSAQTPGQAAPPAAGSHAQDPSERLRAVLPADVAERVLATIAEARARQLPAQALEMRALKFSLRGESPAKIERAVAEHSARLSEANSDLRKGRRTPPSGEEIEAGAEALRQGVDGASVSALAKSAPSGRSLAVPLYVLGELATRGLPSDEALARVVERLAARASDSELSTLPERAVAGRENRPAEVGRDLANTRRPAAAGGAVGTGAGGPPSGLPANAGAGMRPAAPGANAPGGRRP
jgi:hypothetical protein